VRRADTPYHLYVQTVLPSGSFNLPETSGPVQSCKGIGLLLLLTKIYSGNKTKKNKLGGTCSTYWELKTAYRNLVGRLCERRPHGRARHK
jgi:hypothetical protein